MPHSVSFTRPRSTYLDSSSSSSSDSEPASPSESVKPLGRTSKHVSSDRPTQHAPDTSKLAKRQSSPPRAVTIAVAPPAKKKKSKSKGVDTPRTAALVLAMKGFTLADAGARDKTPISTPDPTSTGGVKPKKKKLIRVPRRNSEPSSPSGLSAKLTTMDLQQPTASANTTPKPKPKSKAPQKKRRATVSEAPNLEPSTPTTATPSYSAGTSGTRPPVPRLVITTHRRSTSETISTTTFPSMSSALVDQYRRPRPSPTTSASSSPTSPRLNAPPSPIPSFPPWTPLGSAVDDVAIVQPGPLHHPPEHHPITPSNPAYFIVPSTCDKRRRTVTNHALDVDRDMDHPVKKRKQANGRALPGEAASSSNGDGMLMPTAIDVLDFIKAQGGQCHEGDIFFRFRTGESEHVRSTVNVIIEHFAVVDTSGPGGRRRVTLKQGLNSASSPGYSP